MTAKQGQILLLTAYMISCLTAAQAKTTPSLSMARAPLREPVCVFTAGPGTVVSVRLLELPFVKPRYSIVFKTEDGELIQVWQSGENISLVEGMHGMLIYSRYPDGIVDFRIVKRD